jgi:hypothetical protein
MTDLTRYGHDFGGFLSNEYQNFQSNAKGRYQFNVASTALEIEVSCSVGIFPSQNNTVVVEIECDDEDLKNFSVSQQGSSIVMTQKSSGGGNVFIGDKFSFGGNVTMSGVSMSGNSTMFVNGKKIEIRNGKTYVNGVCVDGIGNDTTPSKEPRIRIFCPKLASLEAKMDRSANLVSLVPFSDADIDLSGQSSFALAAYNLEVDIRGQGKGFVFGGGGKLEVDLSGQGSVNAIGKYSEARLSVSGMGNITTEGHCAGNYRADVSGMGSITNYGQVDGRVKKSVSGMGRINA